jgi:putative phosphoesterase
MKIGILSDAHGNAIALKKCLEYLKEKVDKIFFLGDSCGYFPDVNTVVELLEEYEIHSIKGNHDAMILGHDNIDLKKEDVYQINASKKILTESSKEYLLSLSSSFKMEYNKIKVIMVHGSPADNLYEYVYENSNFIKWKDIKYDIVLMGHTHRPFIKEVGSKWFINVGSCGLPRDYGNLFSMAILDLDNEEYSLKRLKISTEKILDSYPNVHESVRACLKRNNK